MIRNSILKKSITETLKFIQTKEACLKTMNLAQKLQNLIQMESKICKV